MPHGDRLPVGRCGYCGTNCEEARLTAVRNRMDTACTDKLDGKIPEDFWERKMTEWRVDEQQIRMAIRGLEKLNPATAL